MSNFLESKQEMECTERPCSSIEQVIIPKEKYLGDFSVRRLFPTKDRTQVGPWVFFDHMGPATFYPGVGINVRPHPHINLCTVTYLFEGEILHRDSLGSYQAITPGDINLMVSGKGITHSERERPELMESERSLHGLQLWMAMPEEHEETVPAFHHYEDEEIPATKVDGVAVRVMIGSAYGKTSPVKTFSETLYVEATLDQGAELVAPQAPECAVYVAGGEVEVDGVILERYNMAVLKTDREVTVKATEDSRIAFIGGENLGKRYIEWNFVSSSKERIEKAKDDWREGRFPKVPGDEEEFIPLP